MKYCCGHCKRIFSEKEIIICNFSIVGLTAMCEECVEIARKEKWL